jgi:uncharacterized protein YcfJ
MRTILPEVLQPEELKQAEAKPTKEEGPKTLHASKYDRRMKFNTALERSKHEASKEEPVWLKEAASLEELQRRQAVNLIMMEYLNNPNASTRKSDGTSVIDLQQLPEESQAQVQKAFKGLRFAPKRAFDTSSFDGSGITGREGVITVEDELLKTPPLPIEDPPEYDVGNKPVMQKVCKEESFAQRNPVTMSALGALGGSVLGAIPGHFLGGHIKVKMDFRRHAKAMAAAEEKVRRAEQVASDWETRYDTHWKKNPGYSDMKAHEEWRNNIPDNKEQRRNYENSSNARREHLRIMLGRPFEWVSRREGSEIGTPIGAAVGGGLGALGGYKASRPDEKKKVAQPKTASDLYSKVANSSYIRNNLDHLRQYGPDVLEAAQAIMESKEQDALEAGVHKAYHHVKEHRVKEANDASFKGVYPEESFTQRHPAVLPIGLGLLGATVGAVPGAFLGGRAAVRSATKVYQRNLDDVGEAYQRAMNTYNRADNSTPQIVIEKIKENLRNTRNAYRKVKESPPEPGYHRALGQVGGGLLGGLTGGGLGTLGGLELNKPQPWE